MYLISGCLLGNNCKYDGGNNFNKKVEDFARANSYFIVCPEGISGLPTPRPPAEYVGMRIVDNNGKDVTDFFLRGAEISYEKAILEAERRRESIDGAILKAKSPSCGSEKIYNGNFDGTLVDGDGCFAALLKKNGIKVISEKEIEDDKF